MDPVGPWSAYAASYNRLAGATGGFQASPASGGGDFVTSHHHLAATGNTSLGSHQPPVGGVPSTTSQLLLQAAHTTATLAGQLGQLTAAPGSTPSPFSPGGFLTPPSVGYDSVFSPLFHHANPKPAHYGSTLNVSQHRQALAQAQAAASKSNAVDSELSSLRENYSTAHQTIAAAAAASGNSFFDHQGPSSSSLAWTHQGNSQLPSPFGILPHETVVTSPGPATTKASSPYESTFNAHFVAAQSLNHLNSQLAAATTDFNKSSNSYIENANKKTRSQSPHVTPVKTIVSASPVSGGNPFYNQTSSSAYGNSDSVSSRNCTPIAGNFSSKSQHITSAEYTSSTKSYTTTSSLPQQPSCIVSTTTSSSVSSKEYRGPQPSPRSSSSSLFLSSTATSTRAPQATEKSSSRAQNFVPPSNKASLHHGIQTKAQTKIYPELGTADHSRRGDNTHESSQSSPISFAMMDTSTHRQGLNFSGAPNTNSLGSASNASKISDNRSSNSNVQQTQQFQHVLASQTPAETAATTNTSYSSRHYGGLASESASDYHHSSRNVKPSSAADSPYSERLMSSSSASSQNSPDCGVVVPRRPSPLQAHSQASPLSHVPSPGYPLYNSPIASMSSPSPLQLHSETSGNQCSNSSTRQHNGNPSSQQVTPASPLDASVPRPSTQSTQVAYSSVITRALTTGEGSSKSFNNETRSQPHHQEFPQKQNCWDSAERPVPSSRTAGKFTGSNVSYSTSSNVGLDSPHVPPQNSSVSQVRGASNIAERQSTYFESNPGQVTLQDLSNCRGDPMTIVKNLQTLQQPCQIQQSVSASQLMKSDERSASGNSTTRTNSESQPASENSSCATPAAPAAPAVEEEHPKVIVPNIEEELEFLAEVNDIPVTTTPTAASSSGLTTTAKPGPSNNSSPVSSNPASSKIPEKKPFTYSNPGSGFMASYLKFLQGERDSSPPQSKRGNKTWSRTKLYQPPDVPKTTTNAPTTSNNSTASATCSVSMPSSTPSVLKTSTDSQSFNFKPKETPAYDPQDDPRYFPLKKERNGSFSDSDDDFDISNDIKKKALEKEEVKEPEKESESVNEPVKDEKSKTKPVVKTSSKSVLKLQVNTISKITVKPSVKLLASDSVNSECSANEKTEENSPPKTMAQPVTENIIKPLASVSNDDQPTTAVNVDKTSFVVDKGKKSSSTKKIKKKRELGEDLPRRELSRRAVKEKALSNLNQQVLLDEEFDVDEPEFMDSDSDPAWTPAKDSSDDEGSNRRKTRRSVNLLNSRKRARLMSSSLTEDEAVSSSESQDVPSLDRSRRQGKQKSANKGRGRPPRVSVVTSTNSSPRQSKAGSPPASAIGSSDAVGVSASTTDAATSRVEKEKPISGSENKESANGSVKKEESCEIPFKSGEFVVMKSDLKEDHPPIWRIDGKTLLQKYEPFQENGKTLYRNISTYSGWTSQNKQVYQQVRVNFRVQNRMETIVELLRDELYTDEDVFEKSMKETVKYQDNFEVYIQTLISQALDSNFLPEILQEGDEYFLASVKKVDDITEERKQRLLKVTKWTTSVVNSVGTWPCFNVIKDLPLDEKLKLCPACWNCSAYVRVQMYGQPYNSTTLEGCPPDPKIATEKDFLLCKICLARVELYHKVAHQKYLMFIECSQRVAEKRNQNDTTVILNELLANEAWLYDLFQSVRTSWAEIDKLAHQVEKSGKA